MTDTPHMHTSAASPGLIARIDALLPQTQCGKCGHPGCRPYAQGIAAGEPINRCPPGGQETIAQLAELLGTPALPLDVARGPAPAQIAFIREAECIGCTKCIQACPVDAIVGAAKLMHTVLVDECTGCDLCVAPCPVDCIEMHPLERNGVTPIVGGMAETPGDYQARAIKRLHARRRFEARNDRLRRELERRVQQRVARQPAIPPGATSPAPTAGSTATPDVDAAVKKARIAVAMSRAQLNKSLKAFGHPPIAEQAARLAQLQREFEATERELARLTSVTATNASVPVAAALDQAAVKRAKIQLAMARAALGKAKTAHAPADELVLLNNAVVHAEQALSQAQGAASGATLREK